MRHISDAVRDPDALSSGTVADVCEDAVSAAREAATPAAAVEAVVEILHVGLGGAFVAALVLEHERLWLSVMRGYTMIPEGIPLGEGVVGRAALTAEVQFLPDVQDDPTFIRMARGVTSELAIPIQVSGEVVGVLNIETLDALPVDAADHAEPLASALAFAFAELRAARAIDVSGLARLFVHVGSLRDPREIADVAARSLARVAQLETCQVALLDESERLADTAVWRSSSESPLPLTMRELEAVSQQVDPNAVFELLDPAALGSGELSDPSLVTIAVVPLRANGVELGMLAGLSRFQRRCDQQQAELSALLGAHAAASIDSAVALSRERLSALTDPLTGLLNRRGFEERLERQLESAQDDRAPLSLLVLDCDDFKEVNDRAGHEFGDELLREIGSILSDVVGSGGCACRLGGDEFVVMIEAADVDSGLALADEMLARVRDGLDGAGFPLRLSGGLATYPFDGGGGSQLLRAGDQALYEAKAAGKGRVIPFRDVVRGEAAALALAADNRERRRGAGRETILQDVLEAANALGHESSVDTVLERLTKALTFVVGATGCQLSMVEGDRLHDSVRHTLRSVDLGEEVSYLIDDFPVTSDVLRTGRPRSISFLDEHLDRAEAFVLRELKMNCCLLVPMMLGGRAWGLMELYDMRMRSFSAEDEAVAELLVGQAMKRIEALGAGSRRRRLPLYRPAL